MTNYPKLKQCHTKATPNPLLIKTKHTPSNNLIIANSPTPTPSMCPPL